MVLGSKTSSSFNTAPLPATNSLMWGDPDRGAEGDEAKHLPTPAFACAFGHRLPTLLITRLGLGFSIVTKPGTNRSSQCWLFPWDWTFQRTLENSGLTSVKREEPLGPFRSEHLRVDSRGSLPRVTELQVPGVPHLTVQRGAQRGGLRKQRACSHLGLWLGLVWTRRSWTEPWRGARKNLGNGTSPKARPPSGELPLHAPIPAVQCINPAPMYNALAGTCQSQPLPQPPLLEDR